MNVPFLDLKAQNQALKDEILPIWEEILMGAAFIGGPHVKGLEEEFAAACGTSHAVAVGSGTDALRLIFLALGLQSGDEVITVPNTFIATTEAISQAGGKVVFVDVLPGTCNMDPAKLEAAIGPKTRGIVPVHLYGQPADVPAIAEIADRFGLWVVEDACQAHLAEVNGRRAGSMGVAGAFSFYPGKNMGACGEAGMVTTDDANLAATVAMLRDHGQSEKYIHVSEGYNGRCDALQAAALRVKLKKLPEWTEARRRHAARYMDLLAPIDGIQLPVVAQGMAPVWHLFVIHLDGREDVRQALGKRGVACGLHYPVSLHLQEAYAWMGLARGSFPAAEASADRLLSLPMFPELTDEQIRYVCDCLIEVLDRQQAHCA
jgi:dTDP-4-amino-4,6-dideoxygalactose transaminase